MNLKNIILILFLFATVALGVAYWQFSGSQHNGPVLYGDIMLGQNEAGKNMPLRFMVQGKHIYLDDNGDQIPQANEELVNRSVGEVTGSQLATRFAVTKLDLGVAPESVSETLTQKLLVYVDIGEGAGQYTMSGQMELTESPSGTNWLHFGGALEFLAMDALELPKSSGEPSELNIFLGTIANGPSPLASNPQQKVSLKETGVSRTTVVIPSEQPPFPKTSVQFAIPGSEPIVREMLMDRFC